MTSDRDRLIELIKNADNDKNLMWYDLYDLCGGKGCAEYFADYLLANGVILPIRCKNCIHAVELDKHCDISRTAYKHCTLLRGDETKYVWHKYKKYYKDYSIVSLDDFCSDGELKDGEKLCPIKN